MEKPNCEKCTINYVCKQKEVMQTVLNKIKEIEQQNSLVGFSIIATCNYEQIKPCVFTG